MASGKFSVNSASVTTLPITYSQNIYFDQTEVNRFLAYRKNGMLFLRINGQRNASVASTGDFVTIGTISGWSSYADAYIAIPPQNGGGNPGVFQVTLNGVIKVYFSGTTTASKEWIRGQVVTCEYS